MFVLFMRGRVRLKSQVSQCSFQNLKRKTKQGNRNSELSNLFSTAVQKFRELTNFTMSRRHRSLTLLKITNIKMLCVKTSEAVNEERCKDLHQQGLFKHTFNTGTFLSPWCSVSSEIKQKCLIFFQNTLQKSTFVSLLGLFLLLILVDVNIFMYRCSAVCFPFLN